MTLVTDLIEWLASTPMDGEQTFPPVHYQHLPEETPSRFGWFLISGNETTGECLGSEPPDTFYIDFELYSNSSIDLEQMSIALVNQHDYDGEFGSGTIQNVEVLDQKDDYVSSIDRDKLPPFTVSFRLVLVGYES